MWCKNGNNCPWSNCKFRHESCQFGKKCKDPSNCKYDHRDKRKLKVFLDCVDVSTEEKLLIEFFDKGLEPVTPNIYDKSTMTSVSKAVLYKSLIKCNIPFEKLEGSICIRYAEPYVEYPPNEYVVYENTVYDSRDYISAWNEWNTEMRSLFV